MRNFNWHYKTAHELGQSHVADLRDAAMLTLTQNREELKRKQAAKLARANVTVMHYA